MARAIDLTGDWGTLMTSDGWTYQLTDEDILWAARAAACEGGGETSMTAALWTWARRFALPSRRDQFSSLASLIRAHSQPVNPRWARGGEFCAPGGRYADTRFCSEDKLQRREWCASWAWHQIPGPARSITKRWALATLDNPAPLAADFANDTITPDPAQGLEQVAAFRAPGARTANIFYSNEESRRMGPGFLHIQRGDQRAGEARAKTPAALYWVVGLGLLGGAAYWAWRVRA